MIFLFDSSLVLIIKRSGNHLSNILCTKYEYEQILKQKWSVKHGFRRNKTQLHWDVQTSRPRLQWNWTSQKWYLHCKLFNPQRRPDNYSSLALERLVDHSFPHRFGLFGARGSAGAKRLVVKVEKRSGTTPSTFELRYNRKYRIVYECNHLWYLQYLLKDMKLHT